jgi:hypothetical protein
VLFEDYIHDSSMNEEEPALEIDSPAWNEEGQLQELPGSSSSETASILASIADGHQKQSSVTSPGGCFSMIFYGECNKRSVCKYKHDQACLSLTWTYFFKLLQASSLNPRGKMISNPAHTGRTSHSSLSSAPTQLLRRVPEREERHVYG